MRLAVLSQPRSRLAAPWERVRDTSIIASPGDESFHYMAAKAVWHSLFAGSDQQVGAGKRMLSVSTATGAR